MHGVVRRCPASYVAIQVINSSQGLLPGAPWSRQRALKGPCLIAQQGHRPSCSGALRAGEKQARVLGDVEAQFLAGLRRKDGRTVGLGL